MVWRLVWQYVEYAKIYVLCLLEEHEKVRKYKICNTDLFFKIIFTQLYRSRSEAKMGVESTATLLDSTVPPPPYFG